MFSYIKIKIKGYLKNDETNTSIDTTGILSDNTITYQSDNIKTKIIINKDTLTMIREDDKMKHIMLFNKNKKEKSEYFIKEMNYSLEFNIITKEIQIDKKRIHILYNIIETNSLSEYNIEMSTL